MKTCTIEGCTFTAKRVIRGMCATHYNAWAKRVPLDQRNRITRPVLATKCSSPECQAEGSMVRGLCEKHYTRWRRHGDESVTLIGNSPERVTSGGYVERRDLEHPLAKRGWVAVHRAALYDAIGPGNHPCTWCGMELRWDARYQEDSDALLADHLDWNKRNNDPTNLVPACLICNIQRVGPDVRRTA